MRGDQMITEVKVELFHWTKHEIFFTVNNVDFLFEDEVSQREYDMGSKLWDAFKKSKEATK